MVVVALAFALGCGEKFQANGLEEPKVRVQAVSVSDEAVAAVASGEVEASVEAEEAEEAGAGPRARAILGSGINLVHTREGIDLGRVELTSGGGDFSCHLRIGGEMILSSRSVGLYVGLSPNLEGRVGVEINEGYLIGDSFEFPLSLVFTPLDLIEEGEGDVEGFVVISSVEKNDVRSVPVTLRRPDLPTINDSLVNWYFMTEEAGFANFSAPFSVTTGEGIDGWAHIDLSGPFEEDAYLYYEATNVVAYTEAAITPLREKGYIFIPEGSYVKFQMGENSRLKLPTGRLIDYWEGLIKPVLEGHLIPSLLEGRDAGYPSSGGGPGDAEGAA